MKTDHFVQHEGTLNDARIKMKLDENSIAHIQSILVEMYSNPRLATIREYATNAADSHAAAGNTAPIEVTLPSSMDQTYTVRDQGVGMSRATIEENFSRYGWSSKRETNEQTGMLGLGCKAGLAFTSQFTLTSIFDGMKYTVLITRETDGGAALQVVHEEQTIERNGVVVTVPVGDVSTFNKEAYDFFRFWDPGTVLVNGSQPPCIWDGSHPNVVTQLDPDVVLINDTDASDTGLNFIVMGGVPYPAPKAIWAGVTGAYDSGRRKVGVAVRVPIGSVNFTPSREALNVKSPKTQDTIEEIRSFLSVGLWRSIVDRINACATHKEAFDLVQGLGELFEYGKRESLRYKGDKIPGPRSDMMRSDDRRFSIRLEPSTYGIDKAETSGYFSYENAHKSILIVTGFTGKTLYASLKAKARQYILAELEANGTPMPKGYHHLIDFVPTKLASPWCDDTNQVDLDTIKAVELPVDGVPLVKRPKYHIMGSNGTVTDRDSLGSATVCWIETSYEYGGLRTLLGDKAMAAVRKNEEARFKRDNPSLPHFSKWIRQEMVTRHWNITPLLALKVVKGGECLRFVAPFVDHPVDDQDIMELAVISGKTDHWGNYEPDPAMTREIDWWQTLQGFLAKADVEGSTFYPLFAGGKSPDFAAISEPLRDKIAAVKNRHPILENARYMEIEHAIHYINQTNLIVNGLHLHPLTYS